MYTNLLLDILVQYAICCKSKNILKLKINFIRANTSIYAEVVERSNFPVRRLVEEFMLLANMAVAHRIYRAFPQVAVLRRHPPPQQKMLDEMVSRSTTNVAHLTFLICYLENSKKNYF